MSDWWAQRLGGGGAGTARTAPPSPPVEQRWQPGGGQWVPQAPPAPPKVTMHNLIEAMSNWRGGEGARNSARCPSCGSGNYFRRGDASPQCYDCGCNNLFTQVQPRV